jgi:hypothetical protein
MPASETIPEERGHWTSNLWSVVWRALLVVLLPIVLPSQAEIGAAQGSPQVVMVAVVAGFGVLTAIGLPFGLWRRRGLLGSLYRVVGAAVVVRLAFAGPLPLVMLAWMAALVVAVLDGLFSVRADLAREQRRILWQGVRERLGDPDAEADGRTMGPAFTSRPGQSPTQWGAAGAAPPQWAAAAGAPPPPGYEQAGWTQPGYAQAGWTQPGYGQGTWAPPGYPQGAWAKPPSWSAQGAAPPPPSWAAANPGPARRSPASAAAGRSRPGGGRPILAWVLALLALLGVAAFAWASHADALPRSGPGLGVPTTQSTPPPTSQPAPTPTQQAPTATPREVCYRTPLGRGVVCYTRPTRRPPTG